MKWKEEKFSIYFQWHIFRWTIFSIEVTYIFFMYWSKDLCMLEGKAKKVYIRFNKTLLEWFSALHVHTHETFFFYWNDLVPCTCTHMKHFVLLHLYECEWWLGQGADMKLYYLGDGKKKVWSRVCLSLFLTDSLPFPCFSFPGSSPKFIIRSSTLLSLETRQLSNLP